MNPSGERRLDCIPARAATLKSSLPWRPSWTPAAWKRSGRSASPSWQSMAGTGQVSVQYTLCRTACSTCRRRKRRIHCRSPRPRRRGRVRRPRPRCSTICRGTRWRRVWQDRRWLQWRPDRQRVFTVVSGTVTAVWSLLFSTMSRIRPRRELPWDAAAFPLLPAPQPHRSAGMIRTAARMKNRLF